MRRGAALVPIFMGSLALAALAPGSSASPGAVAGGARSAPPVFHRPIVSIGANKSNNWSGYNQGTLEQGGKTFHQASADWVVPRASAHRHGEAEFSSTWVGVGGGCMDANCALTDPSLIQTGTEQDVDTNGHATYSAWWEIIPLPSLTISTVHVRPGDRIHAAVTESPAGSEVWTIDLRDVTDGQSFTMKVPYWSSHATAEWIEETPVTIGSGAPAGVGPLPTLSRVNFDLARTNAARAGLKPSEEIQLADNNGHPLATPSAPDLDADGFNDCAYASTCPHP
ncbi:MAG TPA: G1 family glutamic endopeptidase [Acidimicrobiales bacterium]|nr:G1 family glutamic endopeptidase [Acidimicrobiales bacterium]